MFYLLVSFLCSSRAKSSNRTTSASCENTSTWSAPTRSSKPRMAPPSPILNERTAWVTSSCIVLGTHGHDVIDVCLILDACAAGKWLAHRTVQDWGSGEAEQTTRKGLWRYFAILTSFMLYCTLTSSCGSVVGHWLVRRETENGEIYSCPWNKSRSLVGQPEVQNL